MVGELDSWATASATACFAEVRSALMAQIEAAGGQRALARKWRISVGYINDVKMGKKPNPRKILKRLGFKAVRHPPSYHYERLA